VHLIRRAVALAVLAVLALAVSLGIGALRDGPDQRSSARPKPPTLPGGGRQILPDHRVIALYGAPQDPQLGALGIGSPQEAARRLERQARPYRRGNRKVLPAFELIATIANASGGADGLYRTRQPRSVVRRYLRAARRAGAILILDIQPGRAEFMDEVRAFEDFLREPDVGLALDPEWSLRPPAVPGQEIGSTDASLVNETAAYLSTLVREGNLPQKLLVVHQFTEGMIENREELIETVPGVALVLNVDGFGGQEIKRAKYRDFSRSLPDIPHGFKLFYEEDTDLMSPRQVLSMRPQPALVVYE
jgi:hypothetical protein